MNGNTISYFGKASLYKYSLLLFFISRQIHEKQIEKGGEHNCFVSVSNEYDRGRLVLQKISIYKVRKMSNLPRSRMMHN